MIKTVNASTEKYANKSPLISKDVIDLLNYRIEQEEYSSRVYLAMSMWLDNTGYKNAAKVWHKYSTEEQAHADWSKEYLLSFGIQPTTPMLDKPQESFSGFPEIIRMTYQHEIDVTNQIKELADKAVDVKDHVLYQLTMKYLSEQVEEAAKTQDHLDQLNLFGEDKIAMRLFDMNLGD